MEKSVLLTLINRADKNMEVELLPYKEKKESDR